MRRADAAPLKIGFDPERRDHLSVLIDYRGDANAACPPLLFDLTPNEQLSMEGDGRSRWHGGSRPACHKRRLRTSGLGGGRSEAKQ